MRKSTHTPEYYSLRTTLSRARHDAGLSQRALATRLRVPRSWVAKVESGERRIDLIEFAWVCRACDHDPAELASTIFAQIPDLVVRKRKARPRTGGPR